MQALYISDMDGTLLDERAQLPARTAQLLREAVEAGVWFTVATARTVATALSIMADVPLKLPIVVMNGVAVYDPISKRYLQRMVMESALSERVFALLKSHEVTGFVYSIDESGLQVFYENIDAPHRAAFLETRRQLYGKQFTQVNDFMQLSRQVPLVYISVAERRERLVPIVEAVRELGAQVEFYQDTYQPEHWYMEICHPDASKGAGVRFLRERGGYERVVCFGDNVNDLSMFAASDERYAVANARDEVKSAADGVIGSNTECGVGVWMREHVVG